MITFVISISILENLIWGSDYTIYNINGIVHPILNISGAIFSSIKLTSIRLLLLLVALGFNITQPNLSQKYKKGIIVLMIVYFIMEASQEYIAVAQASGEEIQNGFHFTMILFLGITNIIIFSWIGYELKNLLKREIIINNPIKYKLYRHITLFLIVIICLSIFIGVTETTIQMTSNLNNTWKFIWLFTFYWELVYLFGICFISWIWKPSPNNLLFSYMEILYENSLEEPKTVELEEISKETQ